MRAVMLEVPEHLLEERRRNGHDRFDEMWEGVLHMVPFPSNPHQTFECDLAYELMPFVRKKGLVITTNTGLYLADDDCLAENDYRGPDIVVTRPEHRTDRGVEGGAELIVEVLSPGDESHEKLPWYGKFGVREALYVNPITRVFEFFVLEDGRLRPVTPDRRGRVRSRALGLQFATRAGRLEIFWRGGKATV